MQKYSMLNTVKEALLELSNQRKIVIIKSYAREATTKTQFQHPQNFFSFGNLNICSLLNTFRSCKLHSPTRIPSNKPIPHPVSLATTSLLTLIKSGVSVNPLVLSVTVGITKGGIIRAMALKSLRSP